MINPSHYTGLCMISDSAFPIIQDSELFPAPSDQGRNRLQLLGQALGFGSSKAAVSSLLAGMSLMQPCSSCSMFRDICSSTVVGSFLLVHISHTVAYTDRSLYSLLIFFVQVTCSQNSFKKTSFSHR